MALTDEKHLATVKRVRESVKAHAQDLGKILDDIQDDDEIDDDIKQGLSGAVDNLEEIQDELGGYTGEDEGD